jgi:hypothetical protein
MSGDYFENEKCKSRITKLETKFGKEKTDIIVNKIKEIMNFSFQKNVIYSCAIIDKLIEPDISCNDISAFSYMVAVKLWSDNIRENNKFLQIDIERLVY